MSNREGYVPETHLGQIKIDGKWMDYARGHREESIRWAKDDPENRRVVDWIHKERIIWPQGPLDLVPDFIEKPLTALDTVQAIDEIVMQWKASGVDDYVGIRNIVDLIDRYNAGQED